MFEKIIHWFAHNHLLTNIMTIGCILGGIIFWQLTNKEEMPDITFNFVRVSAVYPGASPQEVEYFVAKPLEEAIQSLDGINEVTTAISQGACSLSIEISPDVDDLDRMGTEIRAAVLDVKLPDEVEDQPSVRIFRTSQRAVIDIHFINTNAVLLDFNQRRAIHEAALSLKDRLTILPSVSEVNWSGKLLEEVRIHLKPEKLLEYNLSISSVISALKRNSVRFPLGSIEINKLSDWNGDRQTAQKSPVPGKKPDGSENMQPEKPKTSAAGKGGQSSGELKVSLSGELNSVEKLQELILQGSFEGNLVRLKNVAEIVRTFEDVTTIRKVNGFEAVTLTVQKSSDKGIIAAVDEIRETVERYRNTGLKNSPITVIPDDDGSIPVKDRLSLIASNGIFGFGLILFMLFLFLNFKAGFWVAMGIPFSFCFTMIVSSLAGYTINNMTLAAVIIVMGMVVDDAIIIAENITRYKDSGMPENEAVVKGTSYVLLPVLASVITTCVAFIPILFMEGRHARFSSVIPPIIFFMLGGSLYESILILPSHLHLHLPEGVAGLIKKFKMYAGKKKKKTVLLTDNPEDAAIDHKDMHTHPSDERHWFHAVEDRYGILLHIVLGHKKVVFLFFAVLLGLSIWLFSGTMKFVLFPNEEATTLMLVGSVPPGTRRFVTAEILQPVEAVLHRRLGREVISYRTDIARGRRGSAVRENEFLININLVPRDKRRISLNKLRTEWETAFKTVPGLSRINFHTRRFGSTSGSVFEIAVQDNDDEVRSAAAQELVYGLQTMGGFGNPEIETEYRDPEITMELNRDMITRLNVNLEDIGPTLRAVLTGTTVFTYPDRNEDIRYKVGIHPSALGSFKNITTIPVANKGRYLVPLGSVLNMTTNHTANTINRIDYKRTTMIYAELGTNRIKSQSSKNITSPVELAGHAEQTIFSDILAKYPSLSMHFRGEVKNTRESSGSLSKSVIFVIFLIYLILALVFNSLTRPVIIMITIPFAAIGIIIAYRLHGIVNFGFFTAIGALGLAGVVVNDSIVMINKLDKESDNSVHGNSISERVANLAKTRLRAIILTTVTTVAGLLPTAYGIFGYDSMMSEMMLAMAWGLLFSTLLTLLLIPAIYCGWKELLLKIHENK